MYKKSILLGTYPQSTGPDREPIEWLVLKEEEKRILCLSRYLLDSRPYHERSECVLWRDCTLRSWLNGEFFMTAFTAEERAKIQLTETETLTGITEDHIFLLCADETDELFDDEREDYVSYEERGAVTTLYARSQGAWYLDEEGEDGGKGCWWLRYCGGVWGREEGEHSYMSCVNFDGYIERAAQGVEETDCCIRPAFWLKTD